MSNVMQDSAFTKPVIDVQDYKNEPRNYTAEIRQMMHGFGDHSEPLLETAKIIEEVVLNQMRAIVKKACEVADMRESHFVSSEDFLFLLRKDKVKLQRLVNYLKLKEFKTSMYKTLDSDLDPFTDISRDDETSKTPFMKFLNHIDNTGELLNDKNLVDHVKHRRSMRIELMTRKMDEARYLEFSKARAVSFANKNRHKFSDWVGSAGEFTITKSGYTVLGYLAYETVAQIVDLAFLVRQDQNKIYGDSIDRLRLSYPNPITYKPYQYPKPIMIKPITPAEVSEALRRYWSPQLEITGPFHRWTLRKPHMKFLSC
ncbi:transcription initiation protein SPT3 homolog [Phymastichus coffea]|uniref:transcription initiation protein SPT3 homolog n=1 Tax=Phymastichus coffea TaxID=108790 RepID=UPI00273CA26A|nr:transcription initiation protein SPT3 homolog [Phymastichus coffea]XP_058796212.1 transcription initiation protein SPT3 homolog [Phymastichus coffea]